MKLNLICRKNNSGNPALPTNEGICLSRGEYLLLLDNDDMITKTALEELYPLAKKFNADVVHCERYLQFNDGEKNFMLAGYQKGELVKEPTFLSDNLAVRIRELYDGKFLANLWSKLIRRDFLIENNIKFANILAQDALFTFCIVLRAPRYLRVPNVVNIYRMVENSLSHKKDDVPEKISKNINALASGFKYLDKFLEGIEIFRNRPDAKYFTMETWARSRCDSLKDFYAQIPAWQLNAFILNELEKSDNNAALTAFLFSRMNIFNINLIRQQQIIQQQQAQIRQLQAQLKN